MPPDAVKLTHHSAEEACARLDELCDAYADAYGVEPGQKTAAFRDRALQAFEIPGFDLVAARRDSQLIGFVFGYTLQPGRGWWNGLTPEPAEGFTTETGARTVVLSEIEVRRVLQGTGVGRALHDAFLDGRPEERATLATGPDHPAQPIYLHLGWQKVGRVPGRPGTYYREYDRFVLSLAGSSER